MSLLRDLALILLAIEAFILALVPLVIFGGLVYGAWWLRRHEHLPRWLHLARTYLELGRRYVELAMAFVVRPIFAVSTFVAKIQGGVDSLRKEETDEFTQSDSFSGRRPGRFGRHRGSSTVPTVGRRAGE
jgi:hypothetical protein